MPKFLTADELANHFRVKRSTILAWRRRGLIPFVRASRRPILFELDAVLHALKRPSSPQETIAITELENES